jgi:hypothetical protein
VLTALGPHAPAGDKHRQRLTLRLLTPVTARYTWQRDELSAGRVEIARPWQVNERTVKRDLARLKADAWLTVRRPSARGRVTVHGIDWMVVLAAKRPAWAHAGPDFNARMSGQSDPAPSTPDDTGAPFPQAPKGAGDRDRASALLHRPDPASPASWPAPLQPAGRAGGVISLTAPSGFHAQYLSVRALDRIARAVRQVAPEVHRVVLTGP